MVFVAVRLRSSIETSGESKETLRLLGLHRVNHAIILEEKRNVVGMLKKTSHRVTWGEVEPPTLAELLRKRGRMVGGGRLTDDLVRTHLGIRSIEEMAKSICEGRVKLGDIHGLKPVFRLTPPSGGFKRSTKRSFGAKGELGYRGKEINSLLLRMM